MSVKKKIILTIGCVIVLMSVIGIFFVVRDIKSGPASQVVNQLTAPGCPDGPLFTISPVDPKDFLSIVPLGNLNPPDHTIPTDHIYITVKSNNQIDPAAAKPVVAPGHITITRISHNTALKSGQVFSDDYSIDFSPCKEVRANFGHVTKLSSELQSAFDQAKPQCQTHHPRTEDEYTYCNADLTLKISVGAPIGEAGGGTSTGLDWQVVDRRAKPLAYANPKRYRDDAFYFICPIDLFDSSTKAILYDRFGGYGGEKRTIEPHCGEVNQDKPGTAQGNWITGGSPRGEVGMMDEPEQWSKTIALVHDNIDPTIGVFSIGGVIGQPTKIQFTPKHEGTINREFSEVRADSQIYCYEDDFAQNNPFAGVSLVQRVIIQLTSETSMNVELQNKPCNESVAFSKPTLYER